MHQNSNRRSSLIRLALGVMVSAGLLVWLFRGVNIREVIQASAALPPWAIIASLAILYLSLPLRAIQWSLLLEREQVSVLLLLRLVCLGYLGNLFLPLRGGEFIKVLLLQRHAKIAWERGLLSILLARIQDIPPISLLGGIALWWFFPSSILKGEGILADETTVIRSLIAVCLLGFFLPLMLVSLMRRRGEMVVSVAHRFSRMLPETLHRHAMATVEKAARALASSAGTGRFWLAQLLAVFCWLVYLISLLPLLLFVAPSPREVLIAATAVTGLTTLAQLIPAAPGALGTYHVLCRLALQITLPALGREEALGLVLVLHFLGTLGTALPGVLFLGLSFGKSGKTETPTITGTSSVIENPSTE